MTALRAGTEVTAEVRRGPGSGTDGPAPQGNPRTRWQHAHHRRLVVTDVAVVVAAVGAALSVDLVAAPHPSAVDCTIGAVALAALWLASLTLHRTRTERVIGTGVDEYRRVVIATLATFGLVAIVDLLLGDGLLRSFLAIALPLGLVGLLLGRFAWRRWLVRAHVRGSCQTSVLVVGESGSVQAMARRFRRAPGTGHRVVGMCIPGGGATREDQVVDGETIPVLGDENEVLSAVLDSGADTVVVTSTERLGHEGIRKLSWELEQHQVDLVLAPGVVDVAGPRLALHPVAGFPLIHVARPRYRGAVRSGKATFDFVFALAALVFVTPVLLVAAVAIKLTSRGPVFYRSERMGINGIPFQMIKFRTMVDGADRQLDTLASQNEGAGGVLFKMREDPRVTRVGRFLRRYSIDELPQFVNVLRGEMSVVGPRPPLRREVQAYDGIVRRRLLVKPGVTGLWQVSGRSDLSWEESVRLDLSYVENWSMATDLRIVAKTIRAVIASDGAY